MATNNWGVFRQDFAGNEFLVEKDLSEARARELVKEYESHKHHQHYWVREIPDEPTDFAELLRQSLRSGSSMETSLMVLRNQSASMAQCIEAVSEVRGISIAESRKVVLEATPFSDHAGDKVAPEMESESDEEE